MTPFADILKQHGYIVFTNADGATLIGVDLGDGNTRWLGLYPVPIDNETGAPVDQTIADLYSAYQAQVMTASGLPWFEDGATPTGAAMQWNKLSADQKNTLLYFFQPINGINYWEWARDGLNEAYGKNYTPAQTVDYVSKRVLSAPTLIANAQALYDSSGGFFSSFMEFVSTMPLPIKLAFSVLTGMAISAVLDAATVATDAALSTSGDIMDASFLFDELDAAAYDYASLASDAIDAQAAADAAQAALDAEVTAQLQAGIELVDTVPSVIDATDLARLTLDAAESAQQAAADSAANLAQLTTDATNTATVAQSTGITLQDAAAWVKIAGGVVSTALSIYKAAKGTSPSGVAVLPIRNASGQLINPQTGQVIQDADGRVLDPVTGQFVTPGIMGVLSTGVDIGGVQVPVWALGLGAILLLRR